MIDDDDTMPVGGEVAMAETLAPDAGPPSSAGVTRPAIARSRRATGAPPSAGTDRYTLGALIGEGGMGEVVLAYDEHIGREVAVKRIRSEEPSPEALARFVREARVQGRLEHPAVVPVHDLAVDAFGRPFFVMKRLSGTTMSEVLRERADTMPRLLRAFADVCLAVEFAHSRGIIHRDLKPANIMLGDFGEVYVLDWGIARAVAEGDEAHLTPVPDRSGLELETGDTRAGTVLGTPAYMAPEQLVGERVGPAADIFALGCILFEIVAGEPLYGNRRAAGTFHEGRPSRKRPDAPPELDAICERATRLDPEARFPSARALGDAVQAYLDGDRDLAMRRELARQHVTEARAALARGTSEADRRIAMQAAGRALALDPTATEAAELVTKLMLEPPEETPAEVEAGIDRIDTDQARTQGRLAAYTMIGYLGFVPLLLWTGVRDLAFVVAFAALAIASGVQVYALSKRTKISSGPVYVSACINAVLIGLICRMVGPFIIAPTLVTTTLMAYAAHPRLGRMSVVSAILAGSVFVPWGLELVGVVSPTYHFVDGELRLSSAVLEFHSAPVQIAFAVLLVLLVTVVALLSRGLASRQRAQTRALELQAWQLRQIVPTRQ